MKVSLGSGVKPRVCGMFDCEDEFIVDGQVNLYVVLRGCRCEEGGSKFISSYLEVILYCSRVDIV